MTRRDVQRALVPLLLAAAATWAIAQEDPKVYRQAAAAVERGTKALQANDAEGARTQFLQALDLIPWLPEAHLGMGHVAVRGQHWDIALREFELARKGFEEAAERRNAAEFRKQVDARTSENMLRDDQKMIAAGGENGPPTNITENRQRELSASYDNKIYDARTATPEGKVAAPAVPADVFFWLGTAHFRLDHVTEAKHAWETCVEVDPKYPPVYNNLAFLYFKAGRVADAKAALDKAEALGVKVNPSFRAAVDAEFAKAKPTPGL